MFSCLPAAVGHGDCVNKLMTWVGGLAQSRPGPVIIRAGTDDAGHDSAQSTRMSPDLAEISDGRKYKV